MISILKYLQKNISHRRESRTFKPEMHPQDIQQIGDELAIKWDDGTETFVRLEVLRRHCPCAGCKGEVDVMGNLYKNPDKPLTPSAFQVRKFSMVGGYAIQPTWGDGHSSGLFSFDYIKSVAATQNP